MEMMLLVGQRSLRQLRHLRYCACPGRWVSGGGGGAAPAPAVGFLLRAGFKARGRKGSGGRR